MQTAAANELVDLGTARRTLIPRRDGVPVSPSTLWRWIRQGINGVRLEVVYIGSKPYTDQQRLERFFDSVTERRLQGIRVDEPTVLTATDDELRAAGVL